MTTTQVQFPTCWAIYLAKERGLFGLARSLTPFVEDVTSDFDTEFLRLKKLGLVCGVYHYNAPNFEAALQQLLDSPNLADDVKFRLIACHV